MGLRDNELLRLEKYANGLGIKVNYRKPIPQSNVAAEWTVDGSEITLYVSERDSKTKTILNFLHELAHHMDHVYNNRQRDPKIEKALMLESNRKPDDPPIKKSLRKLIFEDEVRATQYRFQIAHEIGLKIPEWKIKLDIELDIWVYEMYYLNGDIPSVRQSKLKKKELISKYKE